jgi:hypothetical protein
LQILKIGYQQKIKKNIKGIKITSVNITGKTLMIKGCVFNEDKKTYRLWGADIEFEFKDDCGNVLTCTVTRSDVEKSKFKVGPHKSQDFMFKITKFKGTLKNPKVKLPQCKYRLIPRPDIN